MALMIWNQHFITGIEVIDQQHRWLVDHINASAPLLAMNHGASQTRAEKLLDELMDYAVFHFETEDRQMQEYGIDPRHRQRHLESHTRFVTDVARMRAAYADDPTAPSGGELLSFLTNWLIFHILGEDQALARQIHAIADGMAPAEAYEKVNGGTCDPTHAALTQTLIDVYVLMTEQNRQLMANNHELAAHRTRLEDLVQARTADLVRALDAAQTANRARSSFIANMSHEIRTPMNAIVGLVWSIRQHTADQAQRARLDQVSDAAKQLLAIINDLLDMARIESDRLTMEPLDFDPAKVLREVVAGVSSTATAKGLTLKLDAPDLPPLLRGDPVRLGQIIGNFASNAVKFTESGGVDIRVRRLASGSGRLHLRFEVSDSGPGIAAEAIPRLFQPFGQIDDSTTRRHGGTGLGLAISRRLAEMMGGKVGVDSTLGKGSTFWLDVPLEIVSSVFAADIPSAPALTTGSAGGDPLATLRRHRETLGRLAILLADDDVQAIPLWNGFSDQLQEVFDGHFGPFEAALAAYDFAAAHALLVQVLSGFDESA